MRAEAPNSPQTSPKSLRGTQPRKPTICPPFAPCFQMFFYFCPVEVSQNPEKTQSHPKEFFIFAPFQPILVPFAPVVRSSGPQRESRQDRGREAQHHPTKRGTQQDQPPRWCRSALDAVSQSGTEAHKDRGNATREREREREREAERKKGSDKPTSPQKEGTPPHIARSRQPFPSSQIRAKKSAKSRLG